MIWIEAGIVQSVREIDIALFEFINVELSNLFFDKICIWLRDDFFWIPVYILILYFFIRKFKKGSIYFILGLILTFAVCDSFNSRFMKHTFKRIRPCHRDNIEVVKRVTCGSGFSFPSSHATNHWGISVFLALVFFRLKKKEWAYLSFFWAFSVCFSQIYVGVHFPIDILIGGVEGTIFGFCFFYLVLKVLEYKKIQYLLQPSINTKE